jgi:hypothetical protein
VTAKADIAAAIQSCADASGDLDLRASVGAPGSIIEIRNEAVATGQAFEIPGFLDCLIDGVGSVLDGADATAISGLTNSEGSSIQLGEIVKISGDNTVARSSHASPGVIVGIAAALIAASAVGTILRTGAPVARLVTGLTVTAADILYLSTTVGQLTNVDPGGGIIVGNILDASTYSSPGNPFVRMLINFP